jgi:methionine-S-sulfoxide reductase
MKLFFLLVHFLSLAIFSNLDGVNEVIVGYAGGKTEWPTYKSIQDHTEAVRVIYDPTKLKYEDILVHFANEGGISTYPSYSRQYRSALLVHNEEQRRKAQVFLESVQKSYGTSKLFVDVEDATDFYRGEEYHQKFYVKSKGKYT